jgi:hypothetical protein
VSLQTPLVPVQFQVMAVLEHRRNLNALKAEYWVPRRSPARVLAAMISILGLLALFIVLLRR